ncbi:hypothetical protein KUTeg_021149 [Tegillarca granosa]|uniref:Uncharacterized protein n=1 Tax=Tegillarca granosa TaxID=220873 RepID=A0ABQ9EE29_TEGGR|nr:hypothetical protein KUTeg_021149 [Tegillarca granosa]
MASELNRDLIHTLIDQKILKLLLNNRLSELDLREARPIANQDGIIETIAIRCQRLLKLNLDHFNRKNCNDLVELDLTGCKSITDRGIQPLLVQSSNGDVVMFKKLILLKIMYTNVTSSMAASVILLRKNIDIHYGKTFDAVYGAFREQYVPDQEISQSDKLAVKLLSTEEQVEPLTIEKVNICCLFCPNVVEVILHGDIADELLPPLRYLEKLQKLDLACEKSDQLTFEIGILPLLMDIGNRLLELNLHEINDVCLDSVGACCMKLRRLKCTLSSATSVKLSPKIEEKVFCNLTHLDLQIVPNSHQFPKCTLKNILTNAKQIKDIKLIPTVADQASGNVSLHDLL